MLTIKQIQNVTIALIPSASCWCNR